MSRNQWKCYNNDRAEEVAGDERNADYGDPTPSTYCFYACSLH